MKFDFSHLSQTVTSHSFSIKNLDNQIGNILAHPNQRPKRGLPSDTIANPKSADQQCLAIMTHNGKVIEGSMPKSIAKEGKKK